MTDSQLDGRFAFWFRWSVVYVLTPAASFAMILAGVSMTVVLASSIGTESSLSRPWQWFSIFVSGASFFIGILMASDWRHARDRFRERTHGSADPASSTTTQTG